MTAFKRDQLGDEAYQAAVRSMVQLNANAALAMLKFDVHAATDVTGFGVGRPCAQDGGGQRRDFCLRGVRPCLCCPMRSSFAQRE